MIYNQRFLDGYYRFFANNEHRINWNLLFPTDNEPLTHKILDHINRKKEISYAFLQNRLPKQTVSKKNLSFEQQIKIEEAIKLHL